MADEPKWLALARADLGLREKPGKAHAPRVVQMFAEAGFSGIKDDETAWCAAAVGSWLKRAGVQPSGSLAARSYLDWGDNVDDDPQPGDVVVFERGSGWQGHVALLIQDLGTRVKVIGGNQKNAVTIATYSKTRKGARLLGYRRPPGAAKAAAKAPAKAAPPAPKPVADEKATVTRVQERLAKLGYHEVGEVDGRMGKRTSSAIVAFRIDNGLPLTTDIDDALLAALMTAPPREVDKARATATAGELREKGSSIMNGAAVQQGAGVAVAGGAVAEGVAKSGVLDALTETGETVSEVTEALSPFQSLLAFVGDYIWVALAAIGGVVLWQGIKIAKARLADHRSGKTPTTGTGSGDGS
jgi:uncharacterized protein (TIGR02594 family)